MLDLKSKVPQVYKIPDPGVHYAKNSLNAGVRIQHHNTTDRNSRVIYFVPALPSTVLEYSISVTSFVLL